MLTPASYVTTPGGWGDSSGCWDRVEFEHGSIQFQNGPIQLHGANGIELIDLLRICRDHARSQQRADSSRERSMVITKLDEAIQWERSRLDDANSRPKAIERAQQRKGA